MKNYFFNFLLTAVSAFLIAVVSFLIGNETGNGSVATAMASGVFSGIAISLSYMFGALMNGESWNKSVAIRLVVMLVSGILFGLFGGWTMTL